MLTPSSLTKLLPQSSIIKRGKAVLAMGPGTGMNPQLGMQRNAVRLTGLSSGG